MNFDFDWESEEQDTEEVHKHQKEHYEIRESGVGYCKIESTLSSFPFGVLSKKDSDAVKRISLDILKQRSGLEVYLAGNCIINPFREGGFQQYNQINLLVIGDSDRIEKRYLEEKRYAMEKEPRKLRLPGKIARIFCVEEIPVENTDYENAFSCFEWTTFSSLFHPNPSTVAEYLIEGWKLQEMREQ